MISSPDYRPGDVQTPYGPLRLTVGALAELSDRLDAPSPKDLADRLRCMSFETSRTLLTALLRPCGNKDRIDTLDQAQLADLMPAATQCIVQALERPE